MMKLTLGLVILGLLFGIYVLNPGAAWVALGVLVAYVVVTRRAPAERSGAIG
jgi:hypothetical protein